MIFVANVLEMNGGTTFLVRTCAAMKARNRRCAVLVLRPGGDIGLTRELARHAELFDLASFQHDRGHLLQRQLGAVAPIAWNRLGDALAPFGTTLHAMGAFGLIVAARLARHRPEFRVTAGIYHQNEFLYRAHHFFAAELLALFRRLPSENLVFFNEVSRDNYVRFHDRPDYRSSPLLPIGIDVAPLPAGLPPREGYRIVSVGNLERFKTYNRHIIAIMPELLSEFPDLQYDIYGEGNQREALRAQAQMLGIGDRVRLHGRVAYDRLGSIWDGADLFVGSGTALIEAAAAGLPAMVGVESIEEPLSYGFLSDISGFSYNELGADLPLRPMADLVRAAFADRDQRRAIATACADKAQEFSVAHTAAGLIRLADQAVATPRLLDVATTLRLFVGLPLLALHDRLHPDQAFASRRDQSFRDERS
ncbi:glycosyltransferase family 4 protein [Sphingomonas sp. SORGH_AS_0879]|uniref:glycosyltransferase family 4 protein n=1 Tax=Sphingomonas sp. SORGH_AS_0879 TaxID=3041790 RepID=UPI0027846FE6|nr:glycosyltransferase family 4 protein [Sphingomonas sp. SORGH_AS_0879]MDQ1228603.1 glycosyltransferase involved in cell wall biosynthesis [Sphingomonas sp. SORGH_AS_0879]